MGCRLRAEVLSCNEGVPGEIAITWAGNRSSRHLPTLPMTKAVRWSTPC